MCVSQDSVVELCWASRHMCRWAACDPVTHSSVTPHSSSQDRRIEGFKSGQDWIRYTAHNDMPFSVHCEKTD